MKVIIDPYRGGKDTGELINGQYEKNILLNISKVLKEELEKNGINASLIRENDVSLTDDERNSIINEIKAKGDIIIQNRLSENNEFDIIYSLRSTDELPSYITNNLSKSNILVDNYYQRRLPTNTILDYYSVIRNTNPNEAIIIEYPKNINIEEIIKQLAKTLNEYINKKNIYIVKSGDTMYQIAKKYNITVNELKELNNLTTNELSINQVLKIPLKKEEQNNQKIYIVKPGDTLYQIAKQSQTTTEELKKINNLKDNTLSINQKLILPTKNKEENEEYITYTIQKGDSLYQIAKRYNLNINDIKSINNLKTDNLSIGQKLKIPTTNEKYINYQVEKGDSLYQIAKKFNVTVNEIKSLNNLTSNILSIGQKLKIPR